MLHLHITPRPSGRSVLVELRHLNGANSEVASALRTIEQCLELGAKRGEVQTETATFDWSVS